MNLQMFFLCLFAGTSPFTPIAELFLEGPTSFVKWHLSHMLIWDDGAYGS